MAETPLLPDWIRSARVPGYVEAHELCPGEPRLYGTESLFGDWAGTVLLLAKDFGPTRLIRERARSGDPRPHRHDPGVRTNRRLVELAAGLEPDGLLYGSALSNLLRDDDRMSGALPNRGEAIAYGVEVTRFVIERMPALRWVMCLGLEAWEVGSAALGLAGAWETHRDEGRTLGPLVAPRTIPPPASHSSECGDRGALWRASCMICLGTIPGWA